MPSSDFAEVVLDSDGPLSSAVRSPNGFFEYLLNTEPTAVENSDSLVERSARRSSPLQQWCKAPFEETRGTANEFAPPLTHSAQFSINQVIPKIVEALRTTDVVCLIAPTGSGKSLLAPYIAEQLALLQNVDMSTNPPPKLNDVAARAPKGHRKSLLVAPNVEHAGSTARCFESLFGDSGIRISAFLNPYEERQGQRQNWRANASRADSSPEFVITTYNAAIRVLPHARLNLLILDEVHEPNDNVQVTMAMAFKMLLASSFDTETRRTTSRSLNKLLLMTATLDEKERKNYEQYFTSHGLTFKVLDFTEDLERRKKLTLSCLYTLEDFRAEVPLPEMFEMTPMGDQIAKEFGAKGHCDRVHSGPDLNADRLHNRMRDALSTVMGLARDDLCDRLSDRTGDYDMQSIIVILPGLEQVDRLYSATFKLPNSHIDGYPGFHPVRLTSLVKDDDLITSECSQRGNWKPAGHLGRIVITTNLVAAGLTVPNAAYVIDSGQQKMLREYTRDGLKSLETTLIDRLMIVQRAGRTGRTTNGEYILPYSVAKVEEMVKLDHGDLLINRNFEERHLLYKKLYLLELLHEPPERLRKELQTSMENRGLYSESDGFPRDVILMNTLFNFLPTEFARIVLQGAQLGIAAHVILLVADCISSVKFCRIGLPGNREYYGPSDVKSAVHLYCEAMDAKHVDRSDHRYLSTLPEEYRGVGDSIALADLLVSFFSLSSDISDRPWLDNDGSIEACNFWSGAGSDRTLADLYPAFVRDEGRDAVARFVAQIEKALRAAGLIPPSGTFDPRLNRHVVSRDNFCLNEDGRALLSALLTMHSSRVGGQNWIGRHAVYNIYRDDRPEGTHTVRLNPDACYTQPRKKKRGKEEEATFEKETAREKEARRARAAIYGRYTEMFERAGRYSGLIDPITLKQLTFLLNINGDRILRDDSSECSLLLKLNASTSKRGMKIHLDSSTCRDVDEVRFALERGLQLLTHTRSEGFIADFEQFLIAVWREGASQLELEEMVFDDNPPRPDNSEEARMERKNEVERKRKEKEEEKKKAKEERRKEVEEKQKEQQKRKEEQKKQKKEEETARQEKKAAERKEHGGKAKKNSPHWERERMV